MGGDISIVIRAANTPRLPNTARRVAFRTLCNVLFILKSRCGDSLFRGSQDLVAGDGGLVR
jgi:hypothetical protein